MGLLPEVAQLGCLPVPETAWIASSLVGSTRGSSATGMAKCGFVGCGLSHFSRARRIKAAKNAGRKNREHDILGKLRGTKDKSNRPDPHETRTSRVTRSVAGRVGFGQQAFKSRGSGRVGSGGFQINITGRVRPGRVGSGRF